MKNESKNKCCVYNFGQCLYVTDVAMPVRAVCKTSLS